MVRSARASRGGSKPERAGRNETGRERWMSRAYCSKKLCGPSRKGLRRTQLQRKRRWLEKRVCGLLYSRSLRGDKRARDEVLEVLEREDSATERRYAAELLQLLQAKEW